SEWHLVLITKSESVGFLSDGTEILRIKRTLLLPLNTTPVYQLDLEPCTQCSVRSNSDPSISPLKSSSELCYSPQQNGTQSNKPLIKMMQNQLKNATGNVMTKAKQGRDREKYERRIHNELSKLLHIDGDGCFYYAAPGFDCTHNLQSKQNSELRYGFSQDDPLPWHQPTWRWADKRFFWNFHSLKDILQSADKYLESEGLPQFGQPLTTRPKPFNLSQFPAWSPEVDVRKLDTMVRSLESVLFPVMQGFVQMEELVMKQLTVERGVTSPESILKAFASTAGAKPETSPTGIIREGASSSSSKKNSISESNSSHLGVCLISRRSCFRAGEQDPNLTAAYRVFFADIGVHFIPND
ncbi:hypothetical protein Ciccas_003756, partial [Cichlidogyrus casuarinus]